MTQSLPKMTLPREGTQGLAFHLVPPPWAPSPSPHPPAPPCGILAVDSGHPGPGDASKGRGSLCPAELRTAGTHVSHPAVQFRRRPCDSGLAGEMQGDEKENVDPLWSQSVPFFLSWPLHGLLLFLITPSQEQASAHLTLQHPCPLGRAVSSLCGSASDSRDREWISTLRWGTKWIFKYSSIVHCLCDFEQTHPPLSP